MAVFDGRAALLVTGGAGYIGSHVCKAAAAAGFVPVTFDNLANGHRQAVRWGPLEKGDLRDPARIREALERWRPAAVIHLAGLIDTAESMRDPALYFQHNVVASAVLCDAMRETGLNRLIFSSSAAVYGEPNRTPIDEDHSCAPVSPYGASKMTVERMLADYGRAYGLRSISLRYFNAAGADPDGEIGEAHRNETHLIPLVLEAIAGRDKEIRINGADYPTRDGTCLRDYVHVADLAEAHILAVRHLDNEHGARAINLGSGTGFTVREIVDAAGQIAGRTASVVVTDRRPGDPAALLADARRARDLLGWHPSYSDLETIISTAWRWHRNAWPSKAA